MNRNEFMKIIAQSINTLPEEEFNNAMTYYNEYFDEAGIKKEKKVIKELGDPKKIAEQIMEDYQGKNINNKIELENPSKNSSNRTLLIVLLIMFSPIILPLIFACVVVIAALIFSMFVLAGTSIIGGIISVIFGLLVILEHAPTTLFISGMGLILAGVGLLLMKLFIKITKWIVTNLASFSKFIVSKVSNI